MKFDILNRFTGKVQFTAEIDCTVDSPLSLRVGLSVKWAITNGASLRGADLWGANLRGANLWGANLRDANLWDAYLWGANLWGADLDLSFVPEIKEIHQKVYAAASKDGALDMGSGHQDDFCGTTHCRAGLVTHLAGDAGRVLDHLMGAEVAATLIYMKSDPDFKGADFYASNDEALADMKRCAEEERG